MYLNYVSFDGKALSLTTGNGPVLIGHYMSSAEWRVCSALLASIASSLPQPMISVFDCGTPTQREASLALMDSSDWQRLTLEQVRDTERSGIVLSDGPASVAYLPTTRDEIEDCVYRTFAHNVCLIAPVTCRGAATSFEALEETMRHEAGVEIIGRYFEIDIVINRPDLCDLVVDRVARIVGHFNQL